MSTKMRFPMEFVEVKMQLNLDATFQTEETQHTEVFPHVTKSMFAGMIRAAELASIKRMYHHRKKGDEAYFRAELRDAAYFYAMQDDQLVIESLEGQIDGPNRAMTIYRGERLLFGYTRYAKSLFVYGFKYDGCYFYDDHLDAVLGAYWVAKLFNITFDEMFIIDRNTETKLPITAEYLDVLIAAMKKIPASE